MDLVKDKWIDGWTDMCVGDEWVGRWINGWVEEWIEEWIVGCVCGNVDGWIGC